MDKNLRNKADDLNGEMQSVIDELIILIETHEDTIDALEAEIKELQRELKEKE